LPLTVVVVALAVLLGWLMGRDGWQRTVRGIKTKSAQTKIYPQPAPSNTPVPSMTSQTREAATRGAAPAASGALVVYQNGKVIYRAKPQAGKESIPEGISQISSVREVPATVLLPQVAERYLMQRIEPAYPNAAREQHIQGQVLLEATVGKDGTVQELKAISGDPQLSTAAGDAVRQWRFLPFLKAGKPVEFKTQITVDFRLP